MSTNKELREGVADKAKTCFLYVRVSTKMQVENGESIEAQLYDLRDYAKRNNLRILHEYIDDGYSGKNITGRPHFQEMMEEIKSGVRADYVLVFKLSRFGRNAADALSSLQLMQDYGTNLVCVKDGINSEAQMGKMMIAFMSAFAEMERENILVQTMAGREQKAREGKWNGGQAPYGYKLVKDEKGKGHLEIDEDEAEIVRIIFREYTKNGKGVMALASWLNAQGYRKNVRGNGKYEHFVPTFLKNVLCNPVYIGKIAYGRRRTTPVKGKRNEYRMIKQSDYDVYDGEHEAIIDEATWNAAQERMAEESHPFPEAKTGEHVHLLTGNAHLPGMRAQDDCQCLTRKAKEGRDCRQVHLRVRLQVQQETVRAKLHVYPPVQARVHRQRSNRGHSTCRLLRCIRRACARRA